MTSLGCSRIKIKTELKIIEPEPIPQSYFVLPDSSWDGDETYGGLVGYTKLLKQCLENTTTKLKQIEVWQNDQILIMKKKKKDLGIE
jgi:hypothetical protein